MARVGDIWVLLFTLCNYEFGTTLVLSCLDGTTVIIENSDSPRIKLGFVADYSITPKPDPPMVNIHCNISLEWLYTDYSEPYQVYKTLRRLDTEREDIDLIVLIDFDPQHMQWATILETKHKNVIKLNRRSGNLEKASLRSLVSRFMNGSYDISRLATSSDQIQCHIGYNDTNKTRGDLYFTDTVIHIPGVILANLASQQGWKSVSVIYDKHSEQVTRIYLDRLSQQGIVFAPYNIDEIKDLHAELFNMYNRAVQFDQKIYISVTCRLECLLKVLDIANNFDSRNTEFPTLLSQFSRWMLLVYDYTNAVTELLEIAAHDLDNVAVVAVPGFNPPPVEKIITRLRHAVIEMSLVEFDDEIQRKENYMRNITQKIIDMDPISLCTHYNIKSLFWTTTGRKFQTMGTADLQGKVEIRSPQLFPNTQYGYSKRLFKVVTHVYSPYVSKTVNATNHTEYGGIYIDLLRELAKVLNFTFEIMEPPDDNWGVSEGMINGTEVWNGMVGMLQRREVDLVAAPLTIIPARDKVIDFSYPVSYEYTSIVVKQPDPNAVKWRTLINPFKLEVLLYIGASLPVVTVLICLIEKFGPYYANKNNLRVRKEAGGLHHLHDSFWYMYGALLCQGGVRLPDSFAGRTFVSAWWIFCIIIVGTYCGNLIAFLTVSKVISPFNTLEEMYEQKGTYKWGTMAGTVLETVFTTSSNTQLRKVGDAMIEFNKSDPSIFHQSMDFHGARVQQGFYAWITDTTTIELMMSSTCDLASVKERLLPMKDAFAFQHNSPHTIVFSQQIMKSHEAGLLEIWRRKWWPKQNFCTDKAKFESKPITLRDVQSGFYLCLIGMFLGTVAFVIELLVFKFRKKSNNPQISVEQSGVTGFTINNSDILY